MVVSRSPCQGEKSPQTKTAAAARLAVSDLFNESGSLCISLVSQRLTFLVRYLWLYFYGLALLCPRLRKFVRR